MKQFRTAKHKIVQGLNKFIGKGSTGSIFRNMGVLASGSGLARVISFTAYPIVTRIYPPGDFGVLSVFTSAVAILASLATFRYSIVIPLPKNDGLAFNILVLSVGLIFAIAVILSLLFVSVGEPIFRFFNMVEIVDFWWLLVIGVVGAALYELLSNWATRKKSFLPVAKTNIWQSSMSAITMIVMGVLGFKPLGLLIGAVAQKGGGVPSLIRSFIKDFKKCINDFSINRAMFLFQYYKDLPLFRMPSQFLLVFSQKIPVFYFAFQYGAEATGQLGLSLVVVGIPMGLIGSTTANAYYAEIAKVGAKRKGQILKITKSITKRLSLLGLFPTLVLLFLSPVLFRLAFGSEWEQAGVFTSILAFYLFVQFVTSPLVNVFTVLNRQRKFLEINTVRTVIMAVVFGMSYNFGLNVYQTLILYTIMLSGHYFFTGYQVYKVIKQ